MSNADRSIWQFPKNVANKVPGWRSDGKGLENKDWVSPGDLAGKQDASANLTTLSGLPDVQSGLRDYLDTPPYVATRTALRALDPTKDLAALLLEENREGFFVWESGNVSEFLIGSAIASSAVNSTTETITSVAHGLATGHACVTTTAVNGLALNTIYYVIRVDADNYKLATSYANAHAGTAFNLTGTTAVTIKQYFDPQEGIYVPPTSDLSGASGAWVRKFDGMRNLLWFGADNTGVASSSQALQGADDSLRLGGEVYVPKGNYKNLQPVDKYPGTWWIGPISNNASGTTLEDGVGAVFRTLISATAFSMTGTGSGTNYRGGIKGIGFRGNRALHPNQVLMDMSLVLDHHFEDIFFGDYLDGFVGLDCKALYFRRMYGFGTTQENVRLTGTLHTDNTDHWFNECQFSGDRYGVYINKGLTVNVHNCRPQVSGVATLRFELAQKCKFIGSFADSSAQHTLGGGIGVQLVNCQEVLIDGVNFYDDNPGSSGNIQVTTSAGNNSTGIQIRNCTFSETGTDTGIVLSAPSGGGILNRVSILGCDFSGVSTAITGVANVSSELHLDNNTSLDSAVQKYQAVAGPSTDQSPAASTEVFRMTGTLGTSFNVNLPAAGNYVGKRIKVVRAAAGAGTVTVLGPNGATVGTLTAAGNLDCVCSTSSTTAASVVFVSAS